MGLKKQFWHVAGGAAAAALFASGVAQAADLPKTMVWTAYDFGSAGFAQASAVANAFQKKFGTLESFRQGLTDGLLDDPWSGKTDQGIRLGNNYIADQSEAGGNTAHGRIRQHRYERQLRGRQSRQGSGCLGHLH